MSSCLKYAIFNSISIFIRRRTLQSLLFNVIYILFFIRDLLFFINSYFSCRSREFYTMLLAEYWKHIKGSLDKSLQSTVYRIAGCNANKSYTVVLHHTQLIYFSQSKKRIRNYRCLFDKKLDRSFKTINSMCIFETWTISAIFQMFVI